MIVSGSHELRVQLGSTDIPLQPELISEITVIEYLDKFLPAFRIDISDAEGALTHMIPFDHESNNITIMFRNFKFDKEYDATFSIYRREPIAAMQTSGKFICTGLLDIENLFDGGYERGWSTKTLTEIITDIAINELNCDKVDISPSLNVVKPVVQPLWTNAQLMVYFQRYLYGSDVGGFYTFIKIVGNKKVFVVKNVKDLLAQKSVATFVTNDKPMEDALPSFDFEIIDNYKLSQVYGTVSQPYGNFNYVTGQHTTGRLLIEDVDFESLSDFHLVDKNDSEASLPPEEGSRLNDFVEDYEPVFKGRYHKRLIGLSMMWLLVEGNQTIHPGDIIKLVFIQGAMSGDLFAYQYSGYWLVERAVHSFGSSYRTKLLLTRNGMDTDKETTLIPAKHKKVS